MTKSTALKTTRDFGVLLVEDDASALEELTEIVDLEGWTPYSAASVNDALDILANTPSIGVVVTDVHFVDNNGESDNGIQLISRAQARFADRGLSFVVLSGDPDALRSSLQSGAVDFLNKPLKSEELVEAIQAAWNTGGEERSVTELTRFLLEKMQKTAAALKQANTDLEQVTLEAEDRKAADTIRFKTKMIRRALENGNLLPWLQPQIDLTTGAVYGFDSVARWVDAGGMVRNATAILDYAREAGIEEEVDAAIRSASIRSLGYFSRVGLDTCRITLRVSKTLLETPGAIDDIINEAVGCGLEPEKLKFEISEGIDLDGPDGSVVRENLASMPNRVLRLDIDNTTGFSGVAAMQGVDFDAINLNLKEATAFHLQGEQQAVARALIGLAVAMGVQVIASGVKNPHELTWLREQGCSIAQGNQIAQPLPVEDALLWAQNNGNTVAQEV